MARFALVRVLGNDLPPLHAPEQTLANLELVLEQEPALAGCRRLFVLNRILDGEREEHLARMVERAGMEVVRIPFDPEVYRACRDALCKVAYLTNNNPARNVALAVGLEHGDVVLPFDGQLLFTADAWRRFVDDVAAVPGGPVFAVPMYRLPANGLLATHADAALLQRLAPSEPQLAFARGTGEWFDPAVPYGAGPKLEMLLRLGVPGPWDHWQSGHIRRLRARARQRGSPHFGRGVYAGYAFRLAPGGDPRGVDDIRYRNALRREALRRLVEHADERVHRR